MKGRVLLAALLALALPAVTRADTVFFSRPGEHGIQSVSGTIVQESTASVGVETADGKIVTIPQSDVYQVVRNSLSADGTQGKAFDTKMDGHWDDDDDAYAPRRIHHYGIKGGMNVSNLGTDPADLEDDGSLKSFAVGAWWGTPLSRRMTLSAEALYSVKGDSESSGGYTASTRMGYIDVPVLAKLHFLDQGSAKPALFLGPSLALNVNAKSSLEGGGSDVDQDIKDQVRPIELGMVVGGGVDFAVGKYTYGVELRYCRGLSDAAEESANGSAHNQVIAVMGSIGLQ